jgi:hypothetical protein
VLTREDQQGIARAYLAAFFRRYLKSECVPDLVEYLNGMRSFPELGGFDIAIQADASDALACNQPPVCDASGPYVAECSGASTAVTLDGSGSSDPDLDSVFSRWSGAFTEATVTGTTPTVSFAGPGTFSVDHDASDGLDTVSCSAEVTIQDTLPPNITAPPDMTAECASPAGATPGDLGTPLSADTCDPSLTITSDAPAIVPLGDTIVTWQARDDSGLTASDTQVVTVVDTTPPVIRLSLNPNVLWPPNHKLVKINAQVVATDVCDPQPVIRLESITSSEPDNVIGDGNMTGDIQAAIGTDATQFFLRTERMGPCTGRVYAVTYSATDASGNSSVISEQVTVSHDQGKGGAKGTGKGEQCGGTPGAARATGGVSGNAGGRGHGKVSSSRISSAHS